MDRRQLLGGLACSVGALAATPALAQGDVPRWSAPVIDMHFHMRRNPAQNIAHQMGAGIAAANLLTGAGAAEQVAALRTQNATLFPSWFASTNLAAPEAAAQLTAAVKAGARGFGELKMHVDADGPEMRRAYVLAAAGLLDGRRATTHWGQGARLARLFPNVAVESDRIFIRQDNLWTSAGVTAGIDMALAMIAEDLGDAVARRVAQELVVFHRRPGGQSQFSALLDLEQPEGKLAGLMSWARTRLAEALPVERLAEEAGMSPRNFALVFTAQMGVTPAKAVERLRLEAAREAVETGGEPIDVIARAMGFADPERMRRAFIRNFGQPPQALRRAARRQIAS